MEKWVEKRESGVKKCKTRDEDGIFFFWMDRETKLLAAGGGGREGRKAREKETNVRDKRANDTQDRDRLTGFPRRGTR